MLNKILNLKQKNTFRFMNDEDENIDNTLKEQEIEIEPKEYLQDNFRILKFKLSMERDKYELNLRKHVFEDIVVYSKLDELISIYCLKDYVFEAVLYNYAIKYYNKRNGYTYYFSNDKNDIVNKIQDMLNINNNNLQGYDMEIKNHKIEEFINNF